MTTTKPDDGDRHVELDAASLRASLEGFIQDAMRDEFLRRIEKTYSARPFTRRQAAHRLEQRLGSWSWRDDAPVESRFKRKLARGVQAECVVGSDEEERIIAHALAITAGDGQFTVTPGGAVYATQNNGWTKNKVRIFISGLCPLIDDAADIVDQMTRGKGGRFFLTKEDAFIDAKDRRIFLRISSGEADPEVLKGSS